MLCEVSEKRLKKLRIQIPSDSIKEAVLLNYQTINPKTGDVEYRFLPESTPTLAD